MTSDTRQRSKSPRAAVFASVAGWSFDLFDLFLLLYVAGPVSENIFPTSSPTLGIAAVFGSFAVTVIMRPAGAAIFGEVADRKGRKKAMVTVMCGVGLTTAAMGLVPTYAVVGVLAPVLFLLLRVVQGLFVGGVTASTHTLGTESIGPRWRGLMSGLIGAGGAGLGAALASVAYIAVSAAFPGPAFEAWGWRVLFFCGLAGALLSLFVSRKVEESPAWDGGETGRPAEPVAFRELLRGQGKTILALNVAVAAGGGAQYYLTSGFLPTLLSEVVPVTESLRGLILLVCSLVVVAAAIGAGELSERLGRRTTMLGFGLCNLFALPAVVWAIAEAGGERGAVVALLCMIMVMLSNAAYAPLMIFLNERYPTELRARGTAVSWNLGFMLGGLTPTFVSLLSPDLAHVPSRLAYFLIGSSLVFVLALLAVADARGTKASARRPERAEQYSGSSQDVLDVLDGG
ncbi:MFS transporter [Streptomyces sp. S465]|uniref:MFS transporter n=1 Tax=Streptomyces sp. S465 TaxID=2979468 RepID=UPI0022A85903|nr:MFS transporter [Streptomyces sp. S465]WAP59812.1 MFS transporter [Streptomyces sp. S465]